MDERSAPERTQVAGPAQTTTVAPTGDMVKRAPVPIADAVNAARASRLSVPSTNPRVQRKGGAENGTGLPSNLKSGIENLSGMDLSDVKVHYNSDKPAQLQAHAYAQGTNIHLASGQERHLAHEAWHVVQQKQGRVQPTLQMTAKTVPADLEDEAAEMAAKAENGES